MVGKKQDFAKLILVLLVIISIGTMAGSLKYLSELKDAPGTVQPKKLSPISTENQPENTDIDIKDWKTYSNEQYGFEFKYPDSWNPKENVNTELQIYSVALNQPEISANPKISFTKNPGGVGYEFLKFNLSGTVNVGGVSTQKESFEPTSEFSFSNCNSKNSEGFRINLNKDNNEYEIWATYCQSEENFDANIFDQILSTFKFIEKDETADWKTYRNEEYGFELKYPQDWFINSESLTQISIVNNKYKDSEGEFPYINVLIYNNNENLTLRNWFYDNQSYFFGTSKLVEGKDYQLKDIKIQNSDAIEFSYSRIIKNTLVNINSNIISIGAINSGENYDKILSTFKFMKR